ncbi:SURF1 family protein [Corynebacterium sp. p3-SID1145]|uniref:SURF1 family cytochrome oxidase biogenesis protein n=1 Tax=unclassified Corynebacterium TaxID=2624378 RepID=UPI0021A99BF0|nr:MULTISPECIES: SURF1 family protein [unclassified Corynebacterium]MCT1451577.1 SURF1 family protein [Corynebacterium sp. p3-SID1145]MCT1460416.1 SURF1 family protein [Corynebacterium sp. p3-SID1140]
MTTPKTKPIWRTFLTPGWVLAAVFALAFSWFAITWLSPWQLGKDHDIKERNDRIEKAFEEDPVSAEEVLSSGSPEEWTRVTMTGHYLPEDQLLLRLRPVEGAPAFQSLVPFQLDNGRTVLVNRGWVPADAGGTTVPPIEPAPDGDTTLLAMIRLSDQASIEPITDQGYTMIQSINTAQAAELTGTELAEPYAQLLADEPGVLNPIPLPALDRGNHLSYGLQWIAFGIMAPAGLAYFIYSEVRERRRYSAEQREMEALSATTAATPSGGAPDDASATAASATAATSSASTTSTTSSPAPTRARARYGHTRSNPWATKPDEERI